MDGEGIVLKEKTSIYRPAALRMQESVKRYAEGVRREQGATTLD